ncbi:flagellar biosynthetic protein FliO [Aquibacillus albus]|uniref:Flagellar protein n=1 Tax=Aquibacillus albus TaxID=1168171 RepID=A0ABS2N122_9BACI|nr:flagellar biosynthetic protein FliO [Aquibacillus albus]MBM7571832.1 flagellar protein FliO/FliZ [Aquibacillus albus]
MTDYWIITQASVPSAEDWVGNDEGDQSDDMNQQQDQQQVDGNQPTNETGDSSAGQGKIQSTSNLFVDLLKLMLALAFVIGLIYFLLKFINGKNKMYQRVRALENLGGIPLGTNKSLQVVRIGEKIYVLGVGENVELLTEITDQKLMEDLTKHESTTDFKASSYIASMLKGKNKSLMKDQNHSGQFSSVFKSELNKLADSRKKMINRLKQKEDDHE